MNTIEVNPGANHFARSHGGKHIAALRATSSQGGGKFSLKIAVAQALEHPHCTWFIYCVLNPHGMGVGGCLPVSTVRATSIVHLAWESLMETGIFETQGKTEQAQSCRSPPAGSESGR